LLRHSQRHGSKQPCRFFFGSVVRLQRKQTDNQPPMKKQKLKSVVASPVGALKISQAAKYLGGIAPITVRRLIDRGQLKPCRQLRHILIPVRELDRFLAE